MFGWLGNGIETYENGKEWEAESHSCTALFVSSSVIDMKA